MKNIGRFYDLNQKDALFICKAFTEGDLKNNPDIKSMLKGYAHYLQLNPDYVKEYGPYFAFNQALIALSVLEKQYEKEIRKERRDSQYQRHRRHYYQILDNL